ncbi:Hypothetical protein Y17_0055 [Pectobacterium wasabiae CFBP 3304]|nr:Hypothetical protein Y17_0055 [Pectobacterium wasabiae CFBP 3304]
MGLRVALTIMLLIKINNVWGNEAECFMVKDIFR